MHLSNLTRHQATLFTQAKQHDVRISSSLDGGVLAFESRKPVWEEQAEQEEHPKLELTSSVKWKPSFKALAKEELRHVFLLAQRLASISKAAPDSHFCQAAAAQAHHDGQRAVEFDDNLFSSSLSQTVHAASDDINVNGLQGHADDDICPQTDERHQLFSLSTGEQWSV